MNQFYAISDFNRCKGCQQCKNSCPINAIYYLPSMNKVMINQTVCLGCGRCQQVCKFGAIKLFPRV
ncbi:MAG: 4Fe-4S binding protein [Candidatus Helarchaeota archaeon]